MLFIVNFVEFNSREKSKGVISERYLSLRCDALYVHHYAIKNLSYDPWKFNSFIRKWRNCEMKEVRRQIMASKITATAGKEGSSTTSTRHVRLTF